MINLYNKDCMQALKEFKDNQFDLAIVDPPYGIDAGNMQMGNNTKKKWTKKDWDKNTPTKEYFDELFRISKNQIVWGGNYFDLPPSKCWVVWDKNNGESDFADGEMAWTSFNKPMRIKKIHWCGSASNWEDTNGKIHPTQKPVKLYEWLLMNYANKGDKILDTHLGSGSIAIACHNLRYDLEGYELDKEYFESASKRLKRHQQQLTIF
jgi:site-specific DNA-methyltransferase (adenine-specific)